MSSVSESTAACGQPECSNQGKLRCSACASISYCSSDCQKKHWPVHKLVCKSLKTVSPSKENTKVKSSNGAAPDPAARLNIIKQDIQKCFAKGKRVQSIACVSTFSRNLAILLLLVNTLNAKLVNNLIGDPRRFLYVSINHSALLSLGDLELVASKSEEALELIKLLPTQVALSETIQTHVTLSTAYMHMAKVEESEKHADLAVSHAEQGNKLAYYTSFKSSLVHLV